MLCDAFFGDLHDDGPFVRKGREPYKWVETSVESMAKAIRAQRVERIVVQPPFVHAVRHDRVVWLRADGTWSETRCTSTGAE